MDLVAVKRPQLPHAVWGSMACPHCVQAINATGLRAWCERRVRLRRLLFFVTGSIRGSCRFTTAYFAAAAVRFARAGLWFRRL